MARCDSRSQHGLPQLRLLSSEGCQREGKESMTFTSQGYWGHELRERIHYRDYDSSMGMGARRPRSQGDISSEKSTIATRRSSFRSNTIDGRSTVTPVEYTPKSVRTRATSPRLSLSSTGSWLDEAGTRLPMPPSSLDSFSGKELSALALDPQENFWPPLSPRSHENVYQANTERDPTWSISAPLDRFLAQEEELAEHHDEPARIKEWQKLRSLRTSAIRLRSAVKSKRRELHEKESAKSSADEAFMKVVREAFQTTPEKSFSSNEIDTLLSTHFQALQAARDDYGPAEYAYNALEDSLGGIEFQLAKLEARLYNTKALVLPELPNQDYNPDQPLPPPSISLLGLSSEHASESYHPLQADYLSRLGDLDLARERLHNLRQENEKLLWAQDSRARIDMGLPEHERQILAEFPDNETALQNEIIEIKADAELRRKDCIAEGLELSEGTCESEQEGDSNAEEAPAGSTEELEVTPDEKDISADPRPEISHSMFHILPTEPKDRKVGPENLISEFDDSNKADRIKRWMLQKFRA